MKDRDACLEARLAQHRARAAEYRLILPVLERHPVNALERERVSALDRRMTEALGRPRLRERLLRHVARFCAARWRWRVRWFGEGIQPGTIITRYPGGRPASGPTAAVSSLRPVARSRRRRSPAPVGLR
jgi:hypothetical protein